ncbi:MAG: hypothetical protein O3B33_09550 [Proteobacteria bacterium]|jgi:hypothetical protein|nr:hypothetical protein [Pseudomonadota bacterium]MDA1043521.1 hypothetical protein [Pseudomonadota bacterium]MDO7655823.1 hypothetical protein [Paracoccaceae bacterium]|tara:strand:+ start:202 stop:363 length:162 start_codon:yes stop_codon:yes gene_type:complete
MSKIQNDPKPSPEAKRREDRLKAALKANMAKRKAQIKARSLAASAPKDQEQSR